MYWLIFSPSTYIPLRVRVVRGNSWKVNSIHQFSSLSRVNVAHFFSFAGNMLIVMNDATPSLHHRFNNEKHKTRKNKSTSNELLMDTLRPRGQLDELLMICSLSHQFLGTIRCAESSFRKSVS